MSCWVQPSFAAELWGVPLDRVLGQIDAGEVPARTEDGVLLVDVDPTALGGVVPERAALDAGLAPDVAASSDGETVNVRASDVEATPEGTLMPDELAALFGPSPAIELPAAAEEPVPAPRRTRSGPRRAPAKPVPVEPLTQPVEPTQVAVPMQAIALPSPAKPRRRPPRGRRPAVEPTSEPESIREPVPAPEPEPAADADRSPFARRPAGPAGRPTRVEEEEDEMGPDPNFGEVDDGKPLDWRQARAKAASRRRPPPRFT